MNLESRKTGKKKQAKGTVGTESRAGTGPYPFRFSAFRFIPSSGSAHGLRALPLSKGVNGSETVW
jgi:hypothetical protein